MWTGRRRGYMEGLEVKVGQVTRDGAAVGGQVGGQVGGMRGPTVQFCIRIEWITGRTVADIGNRPL